jgi:hypothetical protein
MIARGRGRKANHRAAHFREREGFGKRSARADCAGQRCVRAQEAVMHRPHGLEEGSQGQGGRELGCALPRSRLGVACLASAASHALQATLLARDQRPQGRRGTGTPQGRRAELRAAHPTKGYRRRGERGWGGQPGGARRVWGGRLPNSCHKAVRRSPGPAAWKLPQQQPPAPHSKYIPAPPQPALRPCHCGGGGTQARLHGCGHSPIKGWGPGKVGSRHAHMRTGYTHTPVQCSRAGGCVHASYTPYGPKKPFHRLPGRAR